MSEDQDASVADSTAVEPEPGAAGGAIASQAEAPEADAAEAPEADAAKAPEADTDDLGNGARLVRGDRAAMAVALHWAQEAGWRPGRHDEQPFLAQARKGVFSVRVNGEVASTVVAARYGAAMGYLGLYLTRPQDRGKGFGTALSRAALEHVADLPILALDGVLEREELYASYGFVRAHVSTRWVTNIERTPVPPPPPGVVVREETINVRALGPGVLADYERRVRAFPAPRRDFLAAWLAMPESEARAVIDRDGEILGYGVVRRCTTGAKIAPLFADSMAIADVLLTDLMARGERWGDVSIDVPDPNQDAVSLVRSRGMAPVFACVRMYRGEDPGLDLRRVYGFTSFELG